MRSLGRFLVFLLVISAVYAVATQALANDGDLGRDYGDVEETDFC